MAHSLEDGGEGSEDVAPTTSNILDPPAAVALDSGAEVTSARSGLDICEGARPAEAVSPNDHGIDFNDVHISFRQVEGVGICVRNLSVTVSPKASWALWRRAHTLRDGGQTGVKILDNVSVDVPAGTLMAVIGGSGSGKTTFLNLMAERMRSQNMKIGGSITYNGSPLSTVRHAYVMQQDVLLPGLTVRETLKYSAELRLGTESSKAERERVVEEVILQLGLKECADTMIGDSQHKGCSGGEKRRVSIGVQLLSNPSVIFLDEPSTGLDSSSAFQLVRTLKNLARKGRTVIATLHQPRSEIWGLFDGITLLSRGAPLFSGSVSSVMPYFELLGYSLPEHVNPADFLADLSAIDYRTPEAEEGSVSRVNGLMASWREHEQTVLSKMMAKDHLPSQSQEQRASIGQAPYVDADIDVEVKARPLPAHRQIMVLVHRTIKTTYRDPMGLAGSLFMSTVMGTVVGWVFYKLDESLTGIRSRQAALYIATSMFSYILLLFETYRLCSGDIQVFDRENGERVVTPFAFLVSRRLAKLATEDFVVPFLFSVIFYFMCGFDNDGQKFMVYFATVLISHYVCIAFATLCVSISRNFSEAVLIGNLSYTVWSMSCGYFVQSSTIPVYVRWARHITYIWYAFGALASNEFTDKEFPCPLEGGLENPECQQYDGNFILDALGFPRNYIKIPLIVNACWALGFYFIAGIVLRYFSVNIEVTTPRTNSEQDPSAGKERILTKRNRETRVIDIVLDDLKLSLHKPGLFGKGGMQIDILKGVSARFEAGKLNVILGASGSGKTTLLHLIARRLHNTPFVRYSSSGKLLLNGAAASDSVISSLCSFVTQDDDALLPSLTVRETLHFAAALRLPKWMSLGEKRRRAEEVILKLGLKDCADVPIGSEFVKGISGGQKRRVTIAVQVLTDPKILITDEPTSGLDSFTAASIMDVLRGLADEGRTIICTIHQGRTDLFQIFGNVLLLARGGHTIYSGKASNMLSYFSSLGHDCPSTTNPADFALDLVTVDLQHEKMERVSRIKVEKLISRYSHAEALAEDTGKSSNVDLPAELGQMQREIAPFRTAYPILVQRGYLNFKRQPTLVVARVMQVLGLGIVLGLWFAPLGNDYYAVQNRMGYIQQILPLYFVGMLQNMALYPNERDVFYREHTDRAYSINSFLLAYTTLELPFEFITALMFSLLGCLAVGLSRTAKMYFLVAGNTFLITNCGESIGIIFNTLFNHSGFSVNVMSTVISIAVLMGGIMNSKMPVVLAKLNYLSPLKYSVQSMVPYSFEDIKFHCTERQKLADGRCPINTGEEALKLYGLGGSIGWKNVVALVAATMIYRLLAYFVLGLKTMRWRISPG